MTDYKAHSHHLYFTDNGWYDGNQRLLFISDRGNRTNLYSLYLVDGTITQLTDLGPEHNDISACLNLGKQLLFTSDRNAYGNLYMVDLPEDADSLPDYEFPRT